MFQNKKTKQKSLNTVNNLLNTYLQVSDKKILKQTTKSKVTKGHQASILNETNWKTGNFEDTQKKLKKSKKRERKIRNKEMKKNEEINNKIIRQSKIDKRDDKIIKEILNDKLKKLNKIDSINKDDELIELQNDVLNLTKTESTKTKLSELRDKQFLSKRKREAELDLFNDKIAKGQISVGGLTPGLAQPGEDSDEETDSDIEDNQQVGNFKDDFDDYL